MPAVAWVHLSPPFFLFLKEKILNIISRSRPPREKRSAGTGGSNVRCAIKPRSTRLRSTSIGLDHPLVKAGLELGVTCYGSPTTSDKALMPFPALKIGPGDSARSHSANEYIYIDEIKNGIDTYI